MKEFKYFLMNHLCDNHDFKEIFCKQVDSEIVAKLKHLATQKYSDYLKYVSSLANKYSLEEFLEIVKKLEKNKTLDEYRIIDIIKGKRLYDN